MQLDYKFGLTGHPLKEFEPNERNAERLKDLLALSDADLITDICKHYVQNFIPSPIEGEDEYWMCTCFPGEYINPVRINIYWHEVFHIAPAEDDENYVEWKVLIFTNREYFTSAIIGELQNKISGLRFDETFTYKKGLGTQLAAFIPIESYFEFVSDERVFESVRQYNYELSNKGRRVHKGHNYELARLLLQK